MEKEENTLEHLRGTNPFRVPDGYMEGLTERLVEKLPDQPKEIETTVSLMDRVRPWLYMAAVFAGLGLFFKAIVGLNGSQANTADSLFVQNEVSESVWYEENLDEDEEYLNDLEFQYIEDLWEDEMASTEEY